MPFSQPIRHLGVVLNPTRASDAALEDLAREAKRHGIDWRLLDAMTESSSPEVIAAGALSASGWKPDAIVALGGDGTVLHTLGSYPGVPTLGINYGNVGFLTAGQSSEMPALFERLVRGDYILDRRLMLQATHNGKTHHVVNEICIRAAMRMVTVELQTDGQVIRHVRGDGVILGTPTGSTAYLMATGGPIVVPTVDCLLFSGINEYRFSSRALILDADKPVTLRLMPDTREPDILVAYDGHHRSSMRSGDTVEVRRHPNPARLIFFDPGYFFKNLRSRLDW